MRALSRGSAGFSDNKKIEIKVPSAAGLNAMLDTVNSPKHADIHSSISQAAPLNKRHVLEPLPNKTLVTIDSNQFSIVEGGGCVGGGEIDKNSNCLLASAAARGGGGGGGKKLPTTHALLERPSRKSLTTKNSSTDQRMPEQGKFSSFTQYMMSELAQSQMSAAGSLAYMSASTRAGGHIMDSNKS